MKKLKIGIVGAGSIARECHIPGFAAEPDCELTAIADPNQNSLKNIRRKWQFRREYASWTEMFAHETLDLVSICTPNVFHADAAIAAMESGADIILEKPVATTLEDAERIRQCELRTGRRVAVSFSHRFNELERAAKKAVDDGAVGSPYMIRIRFAHTGPWPGWASTEWFYNPELAGGGAVLDMGIHAFDLIPYLLGQPIRQVAAFCGTLRKPIRLEDNMVCCLKLDGPCFGYIECGWTSPAGFSGVEICGDRGCITVDCNAGETTLCAGEIKPDGSCNLNRKLLASAPKPHWQSEMAELLRQYRNHLPFTAGMKEGIAALRVALAVYRSSQTGQRIDLEGGEA